MEERQMERKHYFLPHDFVRLLNIASAALGRSRSSIVEEAVRYWLRMHPEWRADLQDVRAAGQAGALT